MGTLRPLLVVVTALGVIAGASAAETPSGPALPRLLELGSVDCVPCKRMAPILEELKREYAGKFEVEFIDVVKNKAALARYQVEMIPTQVFLDAAGRELFRHIGFYSKQDILAKWRELGVRLDDTPASGLSRWQPLQLDTRPRADICYLCDGDIGAHTRVTVKTEKGDVNLCSMHHFFVMISCLTSGVADTEARALVADWTGGPMISTQSAVFLYGLEEATGRPTVKAFADQQAALAERAATGGSLMGYATLRAKELATRCGFCDRAVYPEDAAVVRVAGVYTWGCCSHCALGVAARTGLDVEVHERDRLTGDPIVVTTLQGRVASVEPPTAVAWFGQRIRADDTRTSAGCFHQGFFTSPENLRAWLEANPLETGEMITIDKALADKMALSAQQIQKACKIGECAPR